MKEKLPTYSDVEAAIKKAIPDMDTHTFDYLQKFIRACETLPPSGGGGLNPSLMRPAIYAVRFGMTEESFVVFLRPHIRGSRAVTDSEIRRAYQSAQRKVQKGERWEKPASVSKPQHTSLIQLRNEWISQGQGVSTMDLMMASPIMISVKPTIQALQMVNALYQGGEFIYAGPSLARVALGVNLVGTIRLKQRLHTAEQVDAEYIVPNPFTGKPAPKKSDDGVSLRCDRAIHQFRYAVAEFDNLSIDDQLAFWSQTTLPVAALIFSGGKSIHAWIRCDGITSLEEWDSVIKDELYAQFLIPMGVDRACSNPSRLSRMPGHFRKDKKQVQQLLYLNPAATEGPLL